MSSQAVAFQFKIFFGEISFDYLERWTDCYILIVSSHLRLGLPRGLLLVGIPVNIFNVLLPSSIMETFPAHLKLVEVITSTILHRASEPDR